MKVAVIMGSTSDWGVMSAAVETLEQLGIEYEKRVISAHRTPHLMFEYATTARERGIGAIIADRRSKEIRAPWSRRCRFPNRG